MNILLVSFYFPNSSLAESIQTGRIAKVLSEKHSIDVVTVDMNTYGKYHDNDLGRVFSFKDNVSTFKTGSINILDNKYLSKIISWPPFNMFFPDNKWWWFPMAVSMAEKQIKKKEYDLIYTRAQPFTSNLVGLYLKKKYKIPWIAHFSDPWVDSPFKKKHKKEINFNSYYEKQIFYNADFITMPSVKMEKLYKNKYHAYINKIYTVGHIFDNNVIKYKKDDQKLVNNDKITIVHAGGFYKYRSPEKFLEALSYIKINIDEGLMDRLSIVFLGGGLKSIINHKNKFNLENDVKFIDRVSYLDSISYMQEATVLLMIDTHFANSEDNVFFPSKLVDYLGMGVPIVGIGDDTSISHYILKEFNHVFMNIDSTIEEQANVLYQAIVDLSRNKKRDVTKVFNNVYMGHNPIEALEFLLEKIDCKK